VIVDEGTNPFEVGVATELFGLPRPELGLSAPLYEVTLCAPAREVRMNHGFFTLTGVAGLDAVDGADTLVVPGRPDNVVPRVEAVLEAVRRAHARGARVMSLCTGSFALAEAGLLDGRRATTHWMYTDRLAAMFPKARIDPDVLYVADDNVMTSAGTAAGIDLCLHLVRMDHGAQIANAFARRMVVPPHRDGGQSQFVQAPVPACSGDDPIAEVSDWMVANLHEELSVEELARRALMSPRTFARRFRAATGTTPHQWLLRQRVLHAQHLLESTDEPVERIAGLCGFGSAAVLRQHFNRTVGTSPLAYRRTFQCESA
jgi:transcriptional regulator GlxA family with amidase domain